jgi:proteasome lid subunit RPN8/RPN11
MVIFTDDVIGALGSQIAAAPPEVGGALLGIPCSNVVTRFLPDPDAETTDASYLPTPALRARVREEELRSGLEFRGIVHSHPGSMNHPSQPDLRALGIGLASNSHLPSLVAPIITIDRGAELDDDAQLSLQPRGRLTCYVAGRRAPDARSDDALPDARTQRPREVKLEKAMVGVMPIAADVSAMAEGFVAGFAVVKQEQGYRPVNGLLFISRTLRCDSGELILLFPPQYPVSPPIAFLALAGDPNTQQVSFPWVFSNSRDRLAECRQATLKILEARRHPRESLAPFLIPSDVLQTTVPPKEIEHGE